MNILLTHVVVNVQYNKSRKKKPMENNKFEYTKHSLKWKDMNLNKGINFIFIYSIGYFNAESLTTIKKFFSINLSQKGRKVPLDVADRFKSY